MIFLVATRLWAERLQSEYTDGIKSKWGQMSFKFKVLLGFVAIQLGFLAALVFSGAHLADRLTLQALEEKSLSISKFLQPVSIVGISKSDLHWFEKTAKLVLLSDDVDAIRLTDKKGDVLVDEKMPHFDNGESYWHRKVLTKSGQTFGELSIGLSDSAMSSITMKVHSWLVSLGVTMMLLILISGLLIANLLLKKSPKIESAEFVADSDPVDFENIVELPVQQNITSEIMDKSPDAIVVIDLNGNICQFNFSAEKLFGFPEHDVLGKNIGEMLFVGLDVGRYKNMLESQRTVDGLILDETLESTFRDAQNTLIETNVHVVTVSEEDSIRVVLYIRDVSTQKSLEKKLAYLAFNDELTDLPNLSLLSDHLRKAIFDAKEKMHRIVVIKLGLDRFKHVNESLGHRWGDYLLRTVAGRLKDNVRRGDIVSRINGDQFVVVLVDVEHGSDVTALVSKYVDCFDAPFHIDLNEVHVNVSVGATVCPGDEDTVDGLLRDAESAMFRAKERGGSSYQFFSHEMRDVSHERLYMETELRKALDNDQFTLHYQPQVNLKTGKIIGVEALIRWNHPQMGQVPPAKFIPLAEDTGLIIPIGEWILSEACEHNKALMDERGQSLILAVNLSARQFVDNDLVQTVAKILNETEYPPELLELEITESLLMENMDEVREVLETFSNQGIRISMDDFGTGYSSLKYLKNFPIDTLKVDRSFVHNLDLDEDNASIVKATIQMAHSLNIDIVAEGVETEGQLTFLAGIHCDKIQGYYFSRPLESEDLRNLLNENRKIEAKGGEYFLGLNSTTTG